MEMNLPENLFFGDLLRRFRKRKRLNQTQLAERIEVSRETVSLWERGEYQPEADRILYKIVEVLGLSAQEQQQLFETYTITALATSFHNPPFERNPYFTGRSAQLTDLHALLIKGKQVALTQAINGLGGIGKTQLALEYAYRYQKSYHDIFWVTADTYDSLMSSYVQLATLLRLPEYNEQDQNKVKAAVERWLSVHKGWLIILDNIEDLNLIRQFIPKDRQGAVLLTTRRQVTEPIAQALELEVLPENDAILFLLKRAKVLTVDMSLGNASSHDIEAARAITQLLGNLPLALDQAGAYIAETKCGLTGYQSLYHTRRAEILKERGNLMDGSPEPDYPASVATTWSISFQKVEQINPSAAELLRLCAFLAPDAIPEEIITAGAEHLGPLLQTIAHDPIALNKAIAALGAYSLIRRDPAEKTLSIHRLVQAVLRDAMSEDEEKLWAERTVHAVNAVFPKEGEISMWPQWERYLSHVLVCANLVEQEQMKSREAVGLLNNAGEYLYYRARYIEAKPLLRGVLTIRERQLGGDHSSTAESLNNLAALYWAQGRYEEAEPLHKRALEIYEQQLGLSHPNTAMILNNLAELYRTQGRYGEAEPLFERALSIREEQLGASHPDTAVSLSTLASLYYNQGKYEQAEPLFERALNIKEQSLGSDHPSTAASQSWLAAVCQRQQQYEKAESLYRRALFIFERQWGPDHPGVAASLHSLAELYRMQGRYGEAEPLHKRALALREEQLGVIHPDTAVSLNNLALLYHQQGRYAEALTLYKRALEIYEQHLGPSHPNIAQSLNNLAMLYQAQGKYSQAEPFYQHALAIFEQSLGPQHPNTQQTRRNYAVLLRAMGRDKEAKQLEGQQ